MSRQAEVDFLELFTAGIEELWADYDDGTKLLSIGVTGIYLSIGYNSNRICLTGNEVAPTDNKIGIPRLYHARAILSAKSFEEAVNIATDPDRASSYNNISSPGQVVSVEGSATDYQMIYPENGLLSHSNHYVTLHMIQYEGRGNYESSHLRYTRTRELSQKLKHPITLDQLKRLLSDHGESDKPGENTICRHGEATTTVFSVAVNVGGVALNLGLVIPASQSPNLSGSSNPSPHRSRPNRYTE